MIPPKEKAIELVEKYKPFVYCFMGSSMLTNDPDEGVILSNAKQCALIAIGEIIKANPVEWSKKDDTDPETGEPAVTYTCASTRSSWQEVADEIPNI